MKKIFFAFLASTSLLISSVFAASEFTTPPELIQEGENSITLTWEKLDTTDIYWVNYGTDKEILSESYGDIIENTTVTIGSLALGEEYFFEVIGFDENTGEEMTKTPQASIVIQGEKNTFALESADVINAKNIKLSFNADLSVAEETEFDITVAEKDSIFKLEQEKVEVKNNELIISFAESLKSNTRYEVTVVSATDINGNNIENGVDAITNFETEIFEEDIEFNAAAELTETTDTEEEMNNTSEEAQKTNAGTNISEDDLIKTAESEGDKIEELPTTGPETYLLFLLALFIGTVFFSWNARKNS